MNQTQTEDKAIKENIFMITTRTQLLIRNQTQIGYNKSNTCI